MPSFFTPYDQQCLDRRRRLHVIDWACGDGPLNIVAMGDASSETSAPTRDGLVAAIGNFDGVHLGHVKVIAAAVDHAHEVGMTPAVITFDPHPRRFFQPDHDGFALTDEDDKLTFLAKLGVRIVIRLTFDEALRSTSADHFVTHILAGLNIKHLFAGSDFAFGKGRAGSIDMIAQMGQAQGLTAHPVDLKPSQEGLQSGQDSCEIISSSLIRSAISEGDVKAAARLLGRPFIISGTVIKGDQNGRTIGFPTANVQLGQMQLPAFGVYTIAARLADQDGKIYGGVANLGVRPTATDRGVLLEANLFDYDGDLYGQRLNVFLLDFIRPERAFDDFDALKKQIALDAQTARQFHRDGTRNL